MPADLCRYFDSGAQARACQVSEAHCGPAVVQMLLGCLGTEVTQEQITEAAGACTTIAEQGTRLDQLARAVCGLAPDMRLWHKEHSSVDDLEALVNGHGQPVGVEWQGVFEDSDLEHESRPDKGHYSIVRAIDRQAGTLTIVDPYGDFYRADRVFPIDVFVRRWWDYNEVPGPAGGRPKLKKDVRLAFIVTPREATFPRALGMTAD
ncbi:MAG: C39 family peptidase [Anaerolineae bacterium]